MKNKIYHLLSILFLSCLVAFSQNQGNMLIKNGTILTITNGTQENTDILVSNGKISQIGKNLTAPEGTEVIDATDMFVMPGIIDAHSHIGIDATNEGSTPVSSEVQIRDVLNPTEISIYRALAGGTTISHAMHGSANAIGGQCQTIKHRYGTKNPEAIVMEGAPRTIKFALGENPTRVHGRGAGVRPSTRMGVEAIFRESFTKAKRYMEAHEAYENNPVGAPPAYNNRLEVLADILKGNILIHCHSYRADEIYMLMKVLNDFGVNRITFQHVNEGFKVAPELAEFGAGASIFSDWWGYKFEVYYSTAYNATILMRNGVKTSINSDSAELIRHLNHEAAKSQRYGGLTDEEALSMITINPAWQLGIDDRVGSIEVGKDADFAIFNKHPLSVYAINQKTIVDGIVRFDREKDPDDMRIYINPESKLDDAYTWEAHEENCMANTEFYFGEEAEELGAKLFNFND